MLSCLIVTLFNLISQPIHLLICKCHFRSSSFPWKFCKHKFHSWFSLPLVFFLQTIDLQSVSYCAVLFLSNLLCAVLVQFLALHYERGCFGPPFILLLQRNRSNLTSLALIHRRFHMLGAFDVLLFI